MTPIDLEKCIATRVAIRQHMDSIKRKILVVSGKRGVGKTTVVVGLAQALATMEEDTGILDVDLHNPTVSNMLKINQSDPLAEQPDGIVNSIRVSPHLSVAEVALETTREGRGLFVARLLARTEWGPLEYLLIDTPPGVGDEHLAICEHIPELTGAIIVITSQAGAILDAVRSVAFCRKMGIAILGIIESGDKDNGILASQRGSLIARKTGTPFLGSIPFKVDGQDGARTEEALSLIARQLHENMTCSTT